MTLLRYPGSEGSGADRVEGPQQLRAVVRQGVQERLDDLSAASSFSLSFSRPGRLFLSRKVNGTQKLVRASRQISSSCE